MTCSGGVTRPDVGPGPQPDAVTGVVLAGGASRRFGSDKARAAGPDGRPLVAIAADALAPHVARVLVATGARRRAYPVEAEVVVDAVAGAGPLGGLAAALAACHTPWLLTAACDLPALRPSDLRPLLAAVDAGPAVDADPAVHAAVAVDADGRPNPTVALWRVAAARPVAEAHLAAGRLALRDLAGALGAVPVALAPAALASANTPAELAAAARAAGRAG